MSLELEFLEELTELHGGWTKTSSIAKELGWEKEFGDEGRRGRSAAIAVGKRLADLGLVEIWQQNPKSHYHVRMLSTDE